MREELGRNHFRPVVRLGLGNQMLRVMITIQSGPQMRKRIGREQVGFDLVLKTLAGRPVSKIKVNPFA